MSKMSNNNNNKNNNNNVEGLKISHEYLLNLTGNMSMLMHTIPNMCKVG